MEGLNKIFCGTDIKNTGICDCFFDPKLLTGAILVPKKKVFTNAELLDAAIQSTLETLIMADRKLRIFPIQGFVGVTDSSEEPTNQTFGYGTIEPVKEGHYNWIFQFRNGGVNLSNALRSFNGLTGKYAVIFLESGNHFIGTSKKDANGDNGLAGIPLEVLYTFPWKVNDGSNLASYRTQFNFLAQYVNELIAFKRVDKASYVLSELVGLEAVALELLEGSGTTLTLGANSDCGSTNMYDLFADELANEEAWQGFDSDHTAIAVTSVVKNEDAKGWDVTFASAPSFVSLAAPEDLDDAPVSVSGYESDEIEVNTGS